MFSDTEWSLLYRKRLTIWYFELQPDYVESKYTPNLPGFLFGFLFMFKRQCIRVWSCKLVRYANKWSYRYGILPLDRLKLQLTIPKWNKYQLYINPQKTIRDKNYWMPLVWYTHLLKYISPQFASIKRYEASTYGMHKNVAKLAAT